MNEQMTLCDKSLDELQQAHGKKIADEIPLKLGEAILDYETLLKTDLPARNNILPWLPEGGLVMISAERGLGKTHFALSLVVAISNQEKFMRGQVDNSAGVLYVDGEMVLTEIRNRLKLLTPSIPKESFKILSHEWFFNKFECDLSMTDPDMQDSILIELTDHPQVKVLILDNLASLSRIRENESDDWRAFMQPFLIACRRRGIAVVLIHHCGKNGDQRGSGAREDLLDTSIRLTKPAEYSSADGCCFQVNFTKSRGCHGNTVEPFIAKLVQQDQFSTWEIDTINESTKDRLFRLIAEHGEQGIQAVHAANRLGISKASVSKIKQQLENEGLIQRTTGKIPMRIIKNKSLN